MKPSPRKGFNVSRLTMQFRRMTTRQLSILNYRLSIRTRSSGPLVLFDIPAPHNFVPPRPAAAFDNMEEAVLE